MKTLLSDILVAKFRVDNDAELMIEAGSAIMTISKLLIEDSIDRDTEQDCTLNPADEYGLLVALKLIGHQLQFSGEGLQSHIESQSKQAGVAP